MNLCIDFFIVSMRINMSDNSLNNVFNMLDALIILLNFMF